MSGHYHNVYISETTYWLATDSDKVAHYGCCEGGQLSTGQPDLFLFDNCEDLAAKMIELGFDPPEPEEETEDV